MSGRTARRVVSLALAVAFGAAGCGLRASLRTVETSAARQDQSHHGTATSTPMPASVGVTGGACLAAVPSNAFAVAASARFPLPTTEVVSQTVDQVDRSAFIQRTGAEPTATGLASFHIDLAEQDIVLTFVPPDHRLVGQLHELVVRFPRQGFLGPLTPSEVAPLLDQALDAHAATLTQVTSKVLSPGGYDLPAGFDLAAFAAAYPRSQYVYCGAWSLRFPFAALGGTLEPTESTMVDIAGASSPLHLGFGNGMFVVERDEPDGQTVVDWYSITGLPTVPVGSNSPDRQLAEGLATHATPMRSITSSDWTPPMSPNPEQRPWIILGADAHGRPLAAWVWEEHTVLKEAYAYLDGGISAQQAVATVQSLGYTVRPASEEAPALVDPGQPAWWVPVWVDNGWGYILVDRQSGRVLGQPQVIRFGG